MYADKGVDGRVVKEDGTTSYKKCLPNFMKGDD